MNNINTQKNELDLSVLELLDALKDHSASFSIAANRRFSLDDSLWFFTSGECEIYRGDDNLLITVVNPPFVAGLPAMFNKTISENYFFITSAASEGYKVSYKQAHETIEREHLWYLVTVILSRLLERLVSRDEGLIAQPTYSIIKSKLYDYLNLPTKRQSIASYIQATTGLSRGIVYAVLSQLVAGGYIKTKNGKLIEIIHLPPKY